MKSAVGQPVQQQAVYVQQPGQTYIQHPQDTIQYTTIPAATQQGYEQYALCGTTTQIPTQVDFAIPNQSVPDVNTFTPVATTQDVSLCSPTPYPNQTEQFTCNEHGLFFPSAAILAQHHLQVHMVNKPYKCLDCGQGFTFYSGLKIHARVDHGKLLESASLHKAVTGSVAAIPNTTMVTEYCDQTQLITVMDPNTGCMQQVYQAPG